MQINKCADVQINLISICTFTQLHIFTLLCKKSVSKFICTSAYLHICTFFINFASLKLFVIVYNYIA